MPLITLEGDISITTFEPPSGFDPLAATDAELEQYGFPSRPDHPRLLTLYQRVFTRLKGRFISSLPFASAAKHREIRATGSLQPASILATIGRAGWSSRHRANHSTRCWANG